MALRILTIVGALAAMPVAASAQAPGGVYRLKPGTYVQAEVPCGEAVNANTLRYDGNGLNGAHTRACRARVLSKQGWRYVVDQSCIGAGVGPAPRFTQRQTITLQDALTFTLRTQGAPAKFRYCAWRELPPGFR